MSANAKKPRRYDVATKEEVKADDRRRRKEIRKQGRELRIAFGADYPYYDMFSQLWGWGKYKHNSNPEKAIRRLQKAMRKQRHKYTWKQRPYNKDLQFQVGVAYLCGWLPNAHNEHRAVEWFERSASRGSPQGLMAMGYVYENGIGSYFRDLTKAMDIYARAAELGNVPARYRIAKGMFENRWQCEPEEEENRLKQIKGLLYGASGYQPARELLDQVIERESAIDTKHREDEDWDDEEDGADEEWEDEEYSEDEDWDENDPRIVPYIKEIEKLEWGMDGLKPAGHWLIRMAMLLYQMQENVDNDHWYEISCRYNEVVECWFNEERERWKKEAETIVHQFSEESAEQADVGIEEYNDSASGRKASSEPHKKDREGQETNCEYKAMIMETAQRLASLERSVMKISETTQDTNITVHRTDNNVGIIQETVQEIRTIAEGIWKTQDKMWTNLLETETVGEKQKEYIKQLQVQTANSLTKVSESVMEEEEKFLKWIFGSDWRNESRMCNASCDSLVTARVLMRYGSEVGIRNYAGIIITAISALEIETRRRFFDLYFVYLDREKKPYTKNLTYNVKSNGDFYYTLGSLKKILQPEATDGGAWNNYTVDDFLKDCIISPYAETIMTENRYKHQNQVFQSYIAPGKEKSFADTVIKVVNKYRNNAAHGAKPMTIEHAQACCNLLGIGISRKDYDQWKKEKGKEKAQEDLLNIEGLLKELLRLTKPLQLEKEQ